MRCHFGYGAGAMAGKFALGHERGGRERTVDKAARDKLIEQNLGLAFWMARRFYNAHIEYDDLVSEALIGLVKAAASYDPEKKVRFATYACRCIQNQIRMYLRRDRKFRKEVPLGAVMDVDSDGNEYRLLDVLSTEPDSVIRSLEEDTYMEMLMTALRTLSARDRMIICMRYGIGQFGDQRLLLKDIAEQTGFSQSYVSRIVKRVLVRLRRELLKSEGG